MNSDNRQDVLCTPTFEKQSNVVETLVSSFGSSEHTKTAKMIWSVTRDQSWLKETLETLDGFMSLNCCHWDLFVISYTWAVPAVINQHVWHGNGGRQLDVSLCSEKQSSSKKVEPGSTFTEM